MERDMGVKHRETARNIVGETEGDRQKERDRGIDEKGGETEG
jgi:hypothetical protein